jgi:hypothetical protein
MSGTKAAYLGSVYCDSTEVSNVTDAPITDKTENVDVTSFGSSAVKRFPTVDDADFSITFVRDTGDAGQNKIRDSKSAKTKLTYLRYISDEEYYTLDCYVGDIAHSKGPKEEVSWKVTLIVDGGATLAAVT